MAKAAATKAPSSTGFGSNLSPITKGKSDRIFPEIGTPSLPNISA